MEQEGELAGIEERDEGEGLKLTESQKQEILQQIAEAWRKAQPYFDHPEKLLPNQPFPEQFSHGGELKFEVPFGEPNAGLYKATQESPSFRFLGISKQALGIRDERIQETVFALYNEHGPVELSTFRTDRKDPTDPQRPARETVHIGLREPDEERVLQMEHYQQATALVERLARQGIDRRDVESVKLTDERRNTLELLRYVKLAAGSFFYRTPEQTYHLERGSTETEMKVAIRDKVAGWQAIGTIELKEPEQTPEKLSDEKLAQLKEALPLLLELALRQDWDDNYQKLAMDQRLAKLLDAETPAEIISDIAAPKFSSEKAEVRSGSFPLGWVLGQLGKVYFDLDRNGLQTADDFDKLRVAPREPLVGSPEDFDKIYAAIKQRVGDDWEEQVSTTQRRIEELKQKLGNPERTGGSSG